MPTSPLQSGSANHSPDPAREQPRLGIRGKMIAIIAIPTLVIYVVVLGVMLSRLEAANQRDVKRQMTERATSSAAGFDAAFERAAAVARTTAAVMESAPELTEPQIFAQLRANVLQDDVIYGAAMAFEPGTFKSDDSLFCPYVYRSGEAIEAMNITRDVYDWHADPQWQWWRLAKESGTPTWCDPYFDEGAGNVLMVTFSAPFKRDGRFRGVTTVDIPISGIRERVGREIVGDAEFVMLTRSGDFVYTPREQDIMSGRTIFQAALAMGRDDIAAACRAAISESSGVAEFAGWDGQPPAGWERWAQRSWLFYAPVKSTGWTLAVVVPQSAALAPARARTAEIALGLAVTLILIIACMLFIGMLVTRPISRLAAAVRRIASGDLDHRIDEKRRDELGSLAHDVNEMARDLKLRTQQIVRSRSRSREAMIFAMARLTESRDDDTGRHLERICRYSEILASAVAAGNPSLDEEWIRTISVTAALHDIGKVGIPDAVLKKPGKLTDQERSKMQSHTTIGGDTLIDVGRQWAAGDDFLRIAAEIALAHHERWDGSGYPFGLSGEDISLPARIVAVADVYDALTSKRVYKPPMPHEEAVKMIVEASGRQFDPNVIIAFLSVERKFREVSSQGSANGDPSWTDERNNRNGPPDDTPASD